MPSKRCYFHPDCRSSLFGLPRDAGLREQWLTFIFKSVPEKYNPHIAICAAHFTEDRFLNVREFNAGFAQKLVLKDGAVPTLKAETIVYGPRPGNSGKSGLAGEGDTVARPLKTWHSLKDSKCPGSCEGVSRGKPTAAMCFTLFATHAQTSATFDLLHSTAGPKKITTNDVTASCDEDLDICDLDSVASSVDSTAEEMFIDGLDPVLDGPSHDIYPPEEDYDSEPSHDIYPPEEDCDSEPTPQQRKRSRLSSTSSTTGRNGRESENDGSSGISNEKWHSSDDADIKPPHLDFTPVQEPGPQILPTRCTTALQFFQLLFPKKMWQTIVVHTNDYGAKCQGRKGKVWDYICHKDLKSYIALVIYMGMFRCSSLTDYWSVSEHFSLSFPAKIMSYKKFLSISKALHLSDSKEDEKNSFRKGTAAYERLGKIQPLYQVIREACKTFFHPYQNITILERMVTSQDRTVLKRCVKNKSPNMGYKLFALTDCTCGYTWDFFIYEGKSCASQNVGLSYESVMALVDENMLGSGYKLFVDKFYTSPTLFRDLLYKKIWACGPIWANRTGFPKTVVNRLSKNAPRGTMRWIRDGSLLFVEWKDSQEVQMCSTFHKAYEGDTVPRKMKDDALRTLKEVPIPAVVLDYNRNMEVVDSSDRITGHYRALLKPGKWYQCVFYHFLDIIVENAFIMQELMAKGKNKKLLTRKAFLEALILELTEMCPQV
ncbi:piggyBac transposable element-derived protein 4-like isoform X2 [Sinocyclocheilus grahami]|uniref:piggyBac transposable element-derived protein 4-like isoform X2 n=1 Tax=Sinocyclocheilus grahami TaxID=75366 RepID=UPI0007ACEB5B|nr:PREDICTED: piggyBac transposable element-derived protein 4-like isoform X2 [Sinocyclocheilus grahami]